MVSISLNLFAQWEPSKYLIFSTRNSYTSESNAWCIASSGDSVYVIWFEDYGSFNEIHFIRSMDAGSTWGPDTNLTDNGLISRNPAIAVSGQNVHIVWNENRSGIWEVIYKRSEDGGATWQPDTQLTSGHPFTYNPSIAVLDNNVHVVWQSQQIWHKVSNDGGITWNDPMPIGIGEKPSIALADSMVHVVWGAGNGRVYYARSTNFGVQWEPDTLVSDSSDGFPYPSVAASANRVYISWIGEIADTHKVFFKRSLTGGITWEPNAIIKSYSQPGYIYECLQYTNAISTAYYNNIHLVYGYFGTIYQTYWIDFGEVFYMSSLDGGANWSSAFTIFNYYAEFGNTPSLRPSISVSGTALHVVWHYGFDYLDIMYRRNPTGNYVSGAPSSPITPRTHFSISPNPFTTSTILSLSRMEHGAGGMELTIYDAAGRWVKSVKLKTNTHQLGADLVPGVYFLKATIGEYTETQKLIKIR